MTRDTTNQSNFLRQRRHSPYGLAIVIGLHGAAIAVALLAKSGVIMTDIIDEPPEVVNVPPLAPPPPNPQQDEVLPDPLPATQTRTIVDVPLDRVVETVDLRPINPPLPRGPVIDLTPPPPPIPDPVIREARIDPAYRGALQPRYPTMLLRQELEGSCTIRVRIGADGRVIAAEPVQATHPAFCEATRDQALRRWRFQPATQDGVPVESWQQHTVQFRIT